MLFRSPATSAQTYALARSWNVEGGNAIAVDGSGNVYVAGGSQISKFDPSGAPLAAWAPSADIRRIAIGADGSMFLLGANWDVLKLDANGGLVSTWPGLAEVDRGLAVDAAGNVYVYAFVDNWNIRRISPAGEALNVFGSFELPQAIAVGPDGSVYGTDGEPTYPAVRRFEPDSWTLTAAWGDGFAPREDGESSGDGQFHTPYAIAIRGGKVFVVDGGNSRVQVFDETGHFLTKWSSSANRGVAADANGNVYLYGNGRVEKWAPSSDTPVRASTWGAVKARWSR